MTECQGCGAWNDSSRTLCVLCDTPLAEIDEWDAAAELPPLPPLPDGGLRASMPTWLREPPDAVFGAPSPAPVDGDVVPEQRADLASLGPRADPRTFLSDDDFPQWLRDLAARQQETPRHPAPSLSAAPHPLIVPRVVNLLMPDPDPVTDHAAAPASTSQGEREPAPEPVRPAAALPPGDESRNRRVWEALLLALLFIGVVAAAVWALLANGVLPVE